MELEKKVEQGGFYYITRITHEPEQQRLLVEFVNDPESNSSAKRLLTFDEVEDYSLEFIDDDAVEVAQEEAIDSLIGLSESWIEGKLHYELVTVDRFISFSTNRVPCIEDY